MHASGVLSCACGYLYLPVCEPSISAQCCSAKYGNPRSVMRLIPLDIISPHSHALDIKSRVHTCVRQVGGVAAKVKCCSFVENASVSMHLQLHSIGEKFVLFFAWHWKGFTGFYDIQGKDSVVR